MGCSSNYSRYMRDICVHSLVICILSSQLPVRRLNSRSRPNNSRRINLRSPVMRWPHIPRWSSPSRVGNDTWKLYSRTGDNGTKVSRIETGAGHPRERLTYLMSATYFPCLRRESLPR